MKLLTIGLVIEFRTNAINMLRALGLDSHANDLLSIDKRQITNEAPLLERMRHIKRKLFIALADGLIQARKTTLHD